MGKPPKAILAPRAAPDPAAIEAFIAGKTAPAPTAPVPVVHAAPPAPPAAPRVEPRPPPPPAEPPPPPSYSAATGGQKRTVIRRKDGRELFRTTIYLDPELAQRMGIFAVKQGVDQTEVIKAALAEYLSRHGG